MKKLATGSMVAIALAAGIASVAQVLEHPRHPYTVGLMGSIPRIGPRPDRLIQIAGSMPRLGDVPAGCAFNPRCGFAQERCRVEQPALEPKLGARVRCHFPIRGDAS